MNVTKYYSAPVEVLPLGSSSYLLLTKPESRAMLVSASQLQVLLRCSVPRTIDEHAQALVNMESDDLNYVPLSSSPSQGLAIRPDELLTGPPTWDTRSERELEVKSLIERGLLIALPNWASGETSQSRVPISCLGIVTRDRPAALERCIRSYLSVARLLGKSIEVCVIDGSFNRNTREATIRSIARSTQGNDAQAFYIGHEEKTSLITHLAHTFSPELLHFGLLGFENVPPQTGANRNCLMLATLENCILSVDDDTWAATATGESAETGIRFTSGSDFEEFSFRSVPATRSGPTVPPLDLFSSHEQVSSRELTHILSEFNGSISFGNSLSVLLKRSFVDTRSFRIALSISGLAGTSGMHSPAGLFTLERKSLLNLLRSQTDYERVINSGQLVRRAPQPTITDNPWCMTTAYSIDHRLLRVPFMPMFRNQDGLFGDTCRLCFPEMLFSHTTSVVNHENPVAVHTVGASLGAASVRMADLIKMCMPAQKTVNPLFPSTSSLETVGNQLTSMGALANCELQDYLLSQTRLRLANIYESWERQLALSAGYFPYFERHLSDGLKELESAILQSNSWVPTDLPHSMVDEPVALVKRMLSSYGALLQQWTAITEAVTAWNANAGRLGIHIC